MCQQTAVRINVAWVLARESASILAAIVNKGIKNHTTAEDQISRITKLFLRNFNTQFAQMKKINVTFHSR